MDTQSFFKHDVAWTSGAGILAFVSPSESSQWVYIAGMIAISIYYFMRFLSNHETRMIEELKVSKEITKLTNENARLLAEIARWRLNARRSDNHSEKEELDG